MAYGKHTMSNYHHTCQVRREAGGALYRLCAGGEVAVLAPLLQLLLEHLPRAADMRPHHPHHPHHTHEVTNIPASVR